MKCPQCESDNEASAGSCESCGARLPRRCPGCANELSDAARFCSQCGMRVDAAEDAQPAAETAPAAVRRSDGERRQLTVMFCDLVGSTALSERLDAEDLREVVHAYQDRCARVIGKLAGHIAQYLGDGILVYFGFPLAHEDDAVRALLAGLRILDEIEALNAELPHPMEVRVGVHTGQVVVGDVGGAERRDQLALGDAPNIAARIQGLAEPGTMVVSGATRQLVQGIFECRDLGPQKLDGISRPIELYRVVEESGAQSRFEVALRGGLAALVGRDDELAALTQRWQHAVAGSGQAVLVCGEAGIGKSRLVQAFRDQVAPEEARQVELRSSPHHRNTPLYPVIDYLERLLEFRKGESGEEKLLRLEQTLAGMRTLPADALPLLAALLSLPHPARFAELRLAPPMRRQRTLETIVAWLMDASQSLPVITVWQDLHWADPSTLEFLDILLARVSGGPTLAILTHRPEFEPPWPVEAHVSRIDLGRLGEPHVHAIVDHVARGLALPEDVLAYIVDKTDGVPLFVEELTKTILESGVVHRVDGHYALAGPLDSLAIPSTLQDSLMARLDGFGAAKEIAQLGASLGRSFSHELVEAISPIGGDELRKGLAVLVDAELLLEREEPTGPHYRFKHALIQDAAYESLLKSRRQRVHAQVAQTLEDRFPETAKAQPGLLAHHYTEAGMLDSAVRYWQKAGEKSAKRSANLEAVNQLLRGLDLLRALPESTERDQQELSLQVALGAPLVATRGYASPGVAEVFVRARELCETLGDLEQLFAVLFRLRSFGLVHGQIEEAHELGRELVTLAEDAGNPGLRVEAYYALGAALFYRGDMPDTLAAFGHMSEHYDPAEHEGHAYLFGQEPGVALYSYQAWALAFLGRPARAQEKIEAAVARAEQVGHPFSLAFVWAFRSLLHGVQRQAPEARSSAEKAIAVSQDGGFPIWIGIASAFLGWALTSSGKPVEGIGLIERGIAAFKATGAAVGVPHFQALVGEGCRRTGEFDKGLAVVEEAVRTVRDYQDRYYMAADVHREKGELLLARDGLAAAQEARGCFEHALAVARAQGAKLLELRTATSLARLAKAQGAVEDARARLAKVLGEVEESAELAEHREARALLEELG